MVNWVLQGFEGCFAIPKVRYCCGFQSKQILNSSESEGLILEALRLYLGSFHDFFGYGNRFGFCGKVLLENLTTFSMRLVPFLIQCGQTKSTLNTGHESSDLADSLAKLGVGRCGQVQFSDPNNTGHEALRATTSHNVGQIICFHS